MSIDVEVVKELVLLIVSGAVVPVASGVVALGCGFWVSNKVIDVLL